MKRFITAVTVTAMLLAMVNPVQTGEAQGLFSRVRQRNQAAVNARQSTRKAQQVAAAINTLNAANVTTQPVSYQQRYCDPITGQCTTSWNAGWQPTVTYPATSWSPAPTATVWPTYVNPAPQPRERVVYVEKPAPPVKEIVRYVERPREVETFSRPNLPVADNEYQMQLTAAKVDQQFTGPMKGRSGFVKKILKELPYVRKTNPDITVADALLLRSVCRFAPAAVEHFEAVGVAQMQHDGTEDENVPRDENGVVQRTGINWEGLTEFVRVLIPLLIELLRGA